MIKLRQEHILFKTGDRYAPSPIKDRNGDVVLGLCKRCGKAESQLSEPCPGKPVEKTKDET